MILCRSKSPTSVSSSKDYSTSGKGFLLLFSFSPFSTFSPVSLLRIISSVILSIIISFKLAASKSLPMPVFTTSEAVSTDISFGFGWEIISNCSDMFLTNTNGEQWFALNVTGDADSFFSYSYLSDWFDHAMDQDLGFRILVLRFCSHEVA